MPCTNVGLRQTHGKAFAFLMKRAFWHAK